MKKYLLDTSLVAGYLLNRVRAIDLVSPLLQREEAATSILVYGEVVEYVKSFTAFPTYRESLQALFEHIDPLPLTYPILERYADLRRTLRPQHQEIGDIDTLIAATALEYNLEMVTLDRDFERVSHLQVRLVDLKAL